MTYDASSLPTGRRGLPRRAVVAALAPLAVLAILFAFDVPIGTPGYLIHRYSPVAAFRFVRALPAALVAGAALLCLYRILVVGGPSVGPRAAPAGRASAGAAEDGPAESVECPVRAWKAAAVAGVAWAALVAWTFFAPPVYALQHWFNLKSPSQDGAFLYEADAVTSVRDYVSRGFYERLQMDPHQQRGTRVLSNPPGMTLWAWSVRRGCERWPGVAAAVDRTLGFPRDPATGEGVDAAEPLVFALTLTLVWGLGGVFGYKLARLWLAPTAALAVAAACAFNPATVNFTPGKDPAQVATVLAIVTFGLASYVRDRRLWAAACGAALGASLSLGLVHLWIGVIVAAATVWHAGREGEGVVRWLRRCLLPAALGLAAVLAIWAWLWDWNLVRTVYRVALRYPDIQRYLINGVWTLVGLPMFILFAGPVLWVLGFALRPDVDDAAARLGRRVSLCAAAVMAYAYFFANNNETPRLWIPFLALLPLSMALRRSVFRRDDAAGRRACLALLGLQIAVTLMHWSLMDVRESEYRLGFGSDAPPRLWD